MNRKRRLRDACKVFCGQRVGQAHATIWIETPGRTYPLRYINRYVDGKALSWGRNNPSAANVAFSILADLYGEKEAEFLHGPFLVAVVASLPEKEWRLRADYVCAWVDWLRAETSQAAM